MWTPRRILLMILTLVGLVAVYFAYSRMLGGIDGLPELPQDFLIDTGELPKQLDSSSELPTYIQLKKAFGTTSPEVIDGIAYKLRTQMGEKGIVLASGQPMFSPATEPSRFVTVSPFSIAFFGKPKPEFERLLNEADEITTIHTDKAILEYDRIVSNPLDMSKAKMIGMELLSTPDVLSTDLRRGEIWVTNNQKSNDPSQYLIVRTPGPLYYRSMDENAPPNPDVAQLWTSAHVEVIDRRNLPRPLRSTSTATAAVRGDDLRNRGAIANILLGQTLPPPTIVADGMKIFLTPQDKNAPPPKDANGKADSRNTTGYSGVRLIELTEKVQFNLWSEGNAGFPGASPEKEKPNAAPKAVIPDPPAALAGITGAIGDAVVIAKKMDEKSLTVVETLGGFRYDFQANVARFEAATATSPIVSNHVTVTRLSASDKQDNLFCRLLVVQFEGGLNQPGTPVPSVTPVTPPKKAVAKSQGGASSGMKIKSLTATGEHVFISIESEQLLAQGTELQYIVDAPAQKTTTILRGKPVTAVREKNRLRGGHKDLLGEIVLTSVETAADSKRTSVVVNGPGQIDIFDAAAPAANKNTLLATWGKSLNHEKVKVGDAEQDLLKFEGGAAFIDTQANMDLRANRLWLWLAPPVDPNANKSTAVVKKEKGNSLGQGVPQRLDALGNVESKSPDLIIQKTDQLKLWFRDAPAPEPVAVAVAPAPTPTPTAVPPPMPLAPGVAPAPPVQQAKAEPEKPKPPIELSARVIESWLARYPQKAAAVAAVARVDAEKKTPTPATPSVKYEMERAICEDRVVVHQEPTDPTKSPRGLDIAGLKLNLTATRVNGELGQTMVVTGNLQELAQVHFEAMSLLGPVVKIDQLNNTVAVDGVGSLLMPSNSDFNGNSTDRPNEMEIRFVNSMFFNGAKGTAEFLGNVNATQRPARDDLFPKPELAPPPRIQTVAARIVQDEKKPTDDGTWNVSRILCHRLDVTFDKPIYFNQFRRTESKSKATDNADSPKIKTALCIPMPDEDAAKLAGVVNRIVTYTDEGYTRDNKLLKAQRIEAKELEVRIGDKKQEIFATGPGEVRMLQPDGNSEWGKPAPTPVPAAKKSTAPAPFKLTLVKFTSRMVAVEKSKLYQEAVFTDNSRVWNVPTNNINLVFAEHSLPKGTTWLSSTNSLKVSSSRTKPDGEAEQEMTALGNGEFNDDVYEGTASKITYKSQAITLEGSGDRLARLYRRTRSVNEQNGTGARRYIYYKDGTVTSDESSGGSFNP